MGNNPRPSSGRPPGRRGRGGIGPPAGARTGSHGKGTSHTGNQTGCCPMVAGIKAIRRGKFRLGRRYLAWSFWLIVEKATV